MAKRTRENITGYVGPMFGSKTALMLLQIGAAEAMKEKVAVFKPAIDTRFEPNEIRSRAGGSHFAIAVNSPIEIIHHVFNFDKKPRLVAIDEAEFFPKELVKVVLYLAENGCRVSYTALKTNFRGEPFGSVPELLAISTELVVVSARCTFPMGDDDEEKCGAEAKFTQRLFKGKPVPYRSPIVVIEKPGKTNITYEARCPDHYFMKMPERIKLSDLGK